MAQASSSTDEPRTPEEEHAQLKETLEQLQQEKIVFEAQLTETFAQVIGEKTTALRRATSLQERNTMIEEHLRLKQKFYLELDLASIKPGVALQDLRECVVSMEMEKRIVYHKIKRKLAELLEERKMQTAKLRKLEMASLNPVDLQKLRQTVTELILEKTTLCQTLADLSVQRNECQRAKAQRQLLGEQLELTRVENAKSREHLERLQAQSTQDEAQATGLRAAVEQLTQYRTEFAQILDEERDSQRNAQVYVKQNAVLEVARARLQNEVSVLNAMVADTQDTQTPNNNDRESHVLRQQIADAQTNVGERRGQTDQVLSEQSQQQQSTRLVQDEIENLTLSKLDLEVKIRQLKRRGEQVTEQKANLRSQLIGAAEEKNKLVLQAEELTSNLRRVEEWDRQNDQLRWNAQELIDQNHELKARHTRLKKLSAQNHKVETPTPTQQEQNVENLTNELMTAPVVKLPMPGQPGYRPPRPPRSSPNSRNNPVKAAGPGSVPNLMLPVSANSGTRSPSPLATGEMRRPDRPVRPTAQVGLGTSPPVSSPLAQESTPTSATPPSEPSTQPVDAGAAEPPVNPVATSAEATPAATDATQVPAPDAQAAQPTDIAAPAPVAATPTVTVVKPATTGSNPEGDAPPPPPSQSESDSDGPAPPPQPQRPRGRTGNGAANLRPIPTPGDDLNRSQTDNAVQVDDRAPVQQDDGGEVAPPPLPPRPAQRRVMTRTRQLIEEAKNEQMMAANPGASTHGSLTRTRTRSNDHFRVERAIMMAIGSVEGRELGDVADHLDAAETDEAIDDDEDDENDDTSGSISPRRAEPEPPVEEELSELTVESGVDTDELQFYQQANSMGLPMVRCGTLRKLVERLTYEKYPDADFLQAFLFTYQSFTTPMEFIGLLIGRYCLQPPAHLTGDQLQEFKQNKQVPVRLRVFNLLKIWIKDHFYDFSRDNALCVKLMTFIDEEMPATGMGRQATQLKQTFLRAKDEHEREQAAQSIATMAVLLVTDKERIKNFDKADVKAMARVMTAEEHNMYAQIRPHECFGLAWTRKDTKEQQAPNILKLARRFNAISIWVQMEILNCSPAGKHADRAKTIKKFLKLAQELRLLNNFNGCMEIIAGLQSGPVHRLKLAWEKMDKRMIELFEELKELLSTKQSRAKMRSALHHARPPCIPYLGMYLTDLTFIEDGNKDALENGLINFGKRRLYFNVLDEIRIYQISRYQFDNSERDRPTRVFLDEHVEEASRQYTPESAYATSLEMEPRLAT